jgi:predicted DNA-binding transcriptional regulator AlpA
MPAGPAVEVERPTLAEIRTWPATVPVSEAARAIGVSRATAYVCIQAGTFPARSLRVGNRIVVLTGSIIRVLEGGDVRESA